MAPTLAKFAKFFRTIGRGSGDIVAVKLHNLSITIAKIDIKSNIIHLENLASAPLSVAFAQFMAIGERTGDMDEMLTSIAKYYEE